MLRFPLQPRANTNKQPLPFSSFENTKQIFPLCRTSPLVTPATPSVNFWRTQSHETQYLAAYWHFMEMEFLHYVYVIVFSNAKTLLWAHCKRMGGVGQSPL